MKIVFDHPNPYFLAHGGFQTQIERTRQALLSIGVQVESMRWWDDRQEADIIHFFGRPFASYIHFAHQKRIKVVVAELLTGLGSRSKPQRLLQRALTRLTQSVLPEGFTARLAWESYQLADAMVALTPWEAHLMETMFGAPKSRIHCVPNGVEPEFLESATSRRGQWLVCTATITERKRVLELAQAALLAKTPVWILGKPYAENDPYAQQFLSLAKQNPGMIRYEGAISDRTQLAAIYRQAHGFVLLSTMESLSLSALEATACGCPLLLSDLPWARTTFGNHAAYCPVSRSAQSTAVHLRRFYEDPGCIPAPPRPKSWVDVAKMLQSVYESCLNP